MFDGVFVLSTEHTEVRATSTKILHIPDNDSIFHCKVYDVRNRLLRPLQRTTAYLLSPTLSYCVVRSRPPRRGRERDYKLGRRRYEPRSCFSISSFSRNIDTEYMEVCADTLTFRLPLTFFCKVFTIHFLRSYQDPPWSTTHEANQSEGRKIGCSHVRLLHESKLINPLGTLPFPSLSRMPHSFKP